MGIINGMRILHQRGFAARLMDADKGNKIRENTDMKILVIFTGGTIGSSVNAEGFFSPDQKKGYRLLELYKERFEKSEYSAAETTGAQITFETCEPYTTLSENLDTEHIQKLIACVKENLDKGYDGIIVTHGSDTLQYSAAALGYACGNDTIPVMLVASNYILDDDRANGVDNFSGAVAFICQKAGRGVFVSYKNTGEATQFHRGTRLAQHPAYTDYLFSMDLKSYATLKNGIVERNLAYQEPEDTASVGVAAADQLKADVLWLTAHPMLHFPALSESVSAVLISSYHSGTINTASDSWTSFFAEAQKKQIPVFLTGAVKGMSYESTKVFAEKGICVLPKMAPVAAYVKLLFAGAEQADYQAYMGRAIGGDLME